MIFNKKEVKEKGEELNDNKVQTKERKIEVNINSTSVIRFDWPKTMKLIWHLNGRDMVVLLDSGATHNFVSNKVVDALKIPMS